MMRLRVARLVTLLALLAVVVTACAGGVKATATPTPVSTGTEDPVLTPVPAQKAGDELAGWKYTVTKMGRTKVLRREGVLPVEAKGVWLLVLLQLENTGKATAVFPANQLSAYDSLRKSYTLDSTATRFYGWMAKLPSLDDSLSPRGKASVAAVFDVDANAKGLHLKIGPKQDIVLEK